MTYALSEKILLVPEKEIAPQVNNIALLVPKVTRRIPPALVPVLTDIIEVDRLNRTQIKALTKALVGYSLRVLTSAQFNKLLKDFVTPSNRTALRVRLSENSDMSASFKLATYTILLDEKEYRGKELKVFEDYGLKPFDFIFLFYTLKTTGLYAKCKALLKDKNVTYVPTLHEVHWGCKKLLKSKAMQAFVSKFTYRKLKFVAESNRWELKDLENELYLKAVQAYYYFVPFGDKQHIKNYVKRAIHNHGIRLIYYYTSERRSRNVQDSDGRFYNPVKNLMVTGEFGGSIVDPEVEEALGAGVSTDFSKSDAIISIKQLIPKYKDKERKRKVLNLLLLNNEPNFVDYWNNNLKSRHLKCYNKQHTSTVTDIFEQCKTAPVYLEVIRNYLGVGYKPFYRFIKEIVDKTQ